MEKKFLAAALALLILVSGACAWFGEAAAKKEGVELEFRGLFVSVVYYLLYGSFLGENVDVGLLEIYGGLGGLILANPPLGYPVIHNMIRYFILVLQPLYVTAMIGTGFYIMFCSGSPSGRAKAKRMLPNLFVSMFAVTLSIQLLDLLYSVSRGFAGDIIVAGGIPVETIFLETIDELVRIFVASSVTGFEGGFTMLLLVFLLSFGLLTFLALRYVVLVFFSLVFPFGIFFYSFSATRNFGRTILEQTVLWSFVQAMVAFVAVSAGLGVRFFGVFGDVKTAVGVAAFIVVIVSPLALVSMARRFLP